MKNFSAIRKSSYRFNGQGLAWPAWEHNAVFYAHSWDKYRCAVNKAIISTRDVFELLLFLFGPIFYSFAWKCFTTHLSFSFIFANIFEMTKYPRSVAVFDDKFSNKPNVIWGILMKLFGSHANVYIPRKFRPTEINYLDYASAFYPYMLTKTMKSKFA